MKKKDITKYFKQSLVDSDLNCPEDKEILTLLKNSNKNLNIKSKFVLIDDDFWSTGFLNKELTKQIFKKKRLENKSELTEVELIIIPRIDLYKYKTYVKRKALTPLLAFVKLNKNGVLKPNNKAPWIPRIWLSPNESHDKEIAGFEIVNNFFIHNPFDAIKTWKDLTSYCSQLLFTVIGEKYQKNSSLFELNLHEDYELYAESKSILQIDLEVQNASIHIQKSLEILSNESELPQLYAKFCNKNKWSIKKYVNLTDDLDNSKKHLGQMTDEFPLAPNQRNALHHLFQTEEGDILAVNGPPGTGKTTLLRTVVANMWVQAAIDKTEPPLVVACSNNNQAVTNILDSFDNIEENGIEEHLKGRWLLGISTYGIYCCSQSKAKAKAKGKQYPFYCSSVNGIMEKTQKNYDNKVEKYFLNKFCLWNNYQTTNIETAKDLLHEELIEIQEQVKTGIDLKGQFLQLKEKTSNEKGDLQYWQNTLKQIESLWDKRGFLTNLFMWVPTISRPAYRKTKRLLNELDIQLESYSDKKVEQYLDTKIKIFKECEKAYDKICSWLSHYIDNKQIYTTKISDEVEKILDTKLRFKMFKLATHYWEAEWLLEMQNFNPEDDKKSPKKVLRKYRRFAKLMPCFVSTFYMTPSVFIAGEYQDKNWIDVPLFNEIDLLIIDEAGQATPEVASASFALAKKALVVGDIDQIEPVWNISASIDRANLKAFNLLDNDYDEWIESGLLASSGNVMKVAQNQCDFHQFTNLQRGLYLTEHRRCYNEIIDYCNELVYDNILEPLRGNPKETVPWGSMSFISIDSTSEKYGGSRRNKDEAIFIAKWLSGQQSEIIEYAKTNNSNWSDKDDKEILTLSIGIITPFKAQAILISTELGKKNIDNITVGTVHSLQGAERLIILFSSVYGTNDTSSSKFYDRGKNMLNVAVSRAKDSFIVFGSYDFGKSDEQSPSGILRSKL